MVLSTHVQFNDSLFPYAHSSDMEFNGRRKTPYLRAMTIPYMKNCINREFLIKLFAS